MAEPADPGNRSRVPLEAAPLKKLPWSEIVVAVAVLLIGAGIYAYAHKDVGSVNSTKERGAAIVAALERYRSERGDYPSTLEELVPTYVTAIDQPDWGLQRWTYRRYTGTDAQYFQLSVAANASGHPVLYYDFPARRWVLNN